MTKWLGEIDLSDQEFQLKAQHSPFEVRLAKIHTLFGGPY